MNIKSKIASLLALVLFPVFAMGQNPAINNEANKALATVAGTSTALSTDRFGQQMEQAPFSGFVNGGNDNAEAGSTTTTINATAHSVKVGDWVMFGPSSTARAGMGYVTSTSTNSFTISPPLRNTPNVADLFYFGRVMSPQLDSAGGVVVVPKSGGDGSNLFQQEDAVHASTAYGVMSLAVANANRNTLAAEGDYTPIATDPQGYLLISPTAGLPRSEDNAHTSGDAGVQNLGVAIDVTTQTNLSNAVGDYTPMAVNTYGATIADINFWTQKNAASSLLKQEDTASANADAGVAILSKRADAIATDNNTSTDGDYSALISNNNGGIYVQPMAGASGGALSTSIISAASNNSTNLKATAGTVYSVNACNINAAARYLKLYNKASAPTCGTDTPVLRVAIPGGTTGGCQTIQFPVGMNFGTGIGYCIVTGITDADNTSTAASEQLINITYK